MTEATLAHQDAAQQPLLLSIKEAARLLGLSERSIYQLRLADPAFPQPVRILGPRSWPRWRRADIEAYVEMLAS